MQDTFLSVKAMYVSKFSSYKCQNQINSGGTKLTKKVSSAILNVILCLFLKKNPFATPFPTCPPVLRPMLQFCIKFKLTAYLELPSLIIYQLWVFSFQEMSKSDDTSESAQKLKLATKCSADPYALATQVNTDDLYTSSTQIISKESLYKSETQTDTSDHYTRTTQISRHNLFSSKSEDDNIYNTATQIDKRTGSCHQNDNYRKVQAVCSELSDKVDSNSGETLLYERDLYSNATQVDCSKHGVIERKIVKTDRNSQEQKKLDPYLCATQHDSTGNSLLEETEVDQVDLYLAATQVDGPSSFAPNIAEKSTSNSQLGETQVDQVDLYLEATQVDGPSSFAPDIVEKRTSSSDEIDNNERDLYFEPTQQEQTELDPYDVATQLDSQPDGNYGPEVDNALDSEYDDVILLTDTESVTSDEFTSVEKENETEVSTGNQLSRNQDTDGKTDSGNSTKVMVISAEPGSTCDKKSEPGRISDKREQGVQDQKGRKIEERNVFQDLYMMETQIDDSVKHLQVIKQWNSPYIQCIDEYDGH